ncbi:MAG: hypothetical protein AAF394_16075, partial [Planctomycetota bacterium]
MKRSKEKRAGRWRIWSLVAISAVPASVVAYSLSGYELEMTEYGWFGAYSSSSSSGSNGSALAIGSSALWDRFRSGLAVVGSGVNGHESN